ncbi:MAG TPA: hypothetical protein VGY91_03115 [Chthoniobacterales bacterium]|nr:hypothetical protein [Chthoniobacterales bacterium]
MRRSYGRQLLPDPDLHGAAILHHEVSRHNPAEKKSATGRAGITCLQAARYVLDNEPVDCRVFCALIDGKRSVIKGGPTPLSLISWNAKEVLRHAG